MNRRIQLTATLSDIISVPNLLVAWNEFLKGKRQRRDVQEFQLRLMDNILSLHTDLRNHTYRHGSYEYFPISDPKSRDIHKASVRDRLVHRALYRILYPFFDRTFISDSFSCRLEKGSHRSVKRFHTLCTSVSFSHTKTCFILKCDIRKFFANIDHEILLALLARSIPDKKIILLLMEILGSFQVGLPLGNLTSQLMVNIYMNEFDQFVKHKLKVKYYIRYADDFVLLSSDKTELEQLLPLIEEFLHTRLRLSLHPDKVFIKTLASGADFLGWVHFPDHRVLRTATKRRMFARINGHNLGSYLGLCKHGNTFKIQELIKVKMN